MKQEYQLHSLATRQNFAIRLPLKIRKYGGPHRWGGAPHKILRFPILSLKIWLLFYMVFRGSDYIDECLNDYTLRLLRLCNKRHSIRKLSLLTTTFRSKLGPSSGGTESESYGYIRTEDLSQEHRVPQRGNRTPSSPTGEQVIRCHYQQAWGRHG